jgi:hypothetical protein
MTKNTPRITFRRLTIMPHFFSQEIYKSPPLQTLVSSEDNTFSLPIFYKFTNMAFSDSGTDMDSNLDIPGSLTDTTGSPAGLTELPQERHRVVDAMDRLRATR